MPLSTSSDSVLKPTASADSFADNSAETLYKPHTAVEQRALELLGSGVGSEAVAAAVGVTPGYISQLLSNEDFAAAVSSRRCESLAANNERDGRYDSIEDKLLVKLEKSLPLMIRPMEITKALHAVNSCKRRGQASTDTTPNKQVIVQLVVPTQIAQKFTTNVNNQVVKAGDQELLTISSAVLLKQTEAKLEQELTPPTLEEQTNAALLEQLGG